MPIDLRTESVLTPTEAAVRLRKSTGTIKRWILAGILEGVAMPGGLVTSIEAIERLAERLSQARGLGKPAPASPAVNAKAEKEALAFLRSRGMAC